MPHTLLEAAIRNPYQALSLVLGDTLHPGGEQATEDLLDRARVQEGTRVLDLGCGAGAALQTARARGAEPLGIDTDPTADGAMLCADLQRLPLGDASVEVVFSECALCLADDVEQALTEARRVLGPEGRLAFSDVTLERSLETLPRRVKQALCLTGERGRDRLIDQVETAGFQVVDERDHRDDLLAMRDRIYARVDVEGLLAAMGSTGKELLAGVQETEDALEAGELGYLSLVANPV